jgi:hypothetical protein
VRGASALDGLLAEFPDAALHVQVVWEPVLATDVAPPLTRVLGLVDDRRVKQYWDADRVLSADLVRAVNEEPARYGFEGRLPEDFIAWDVIAVFGASANWTSNVPVPAYYGGPVVDVAGESRSAIREQLAVASMPTR